MKVVELKFNEKSFGRFMNYIEPKNINYEITKDELDDLNESIANNDILKASSFFENKIKVCDEIEKDVVMDKVNDLWQYIMNSSYEIWHSDPSLSRIQFLDKLSSYEKLAVQLGNFNYQVENGGLMQWDENGYSEDVYELMDFIKCSDFSKKYEILDILDNFIHIKNSIDKLDENDDFYDGDLQTRYSELNRYDKIYYSLKDELKDFFENYLVETIPKEYFDKIQNIESMSI